MRSERVVPERLENTLEDQHGIGTSRIDRHLVAILERQEVGQVFLVQRQLQLLPPSERADEVSRQLVHLRCHSLQPILRGGLAEQPERENAPALDLLRLRLRHQEGAVERLRSDDSERLEERDLFVDG